MGDVVSLSGYRADREGGAGALVRLDRAVQRLDPLVNARLDRLSPTIQRELVSIARALSAGRPARAAERAERLAGILEHPAASG